MEQVQKTVFSSSQEALKLTEKIHETLKNPNNTLFEMSSYYFDGQGKGVRPAVTLSVARACNNHLKVKLTKHGWQDILIQYFFKVDSEELDYLQKQIAIICEMFHTSSLLHDDVIDHAETRRGKTSVNCKWTQASSIQAGVFILSISTKLLAQTNNPEVISSMSQILTDLVNGEFQQMASKADKNDRFQLYLDKTFNKTASLMANSCKSVALLANMNTNDPHIVVSN